MMLRNNIVFGMDRFLLGNRYTRRWRSRLIYPNLTRVMRSNLEAPTKFLNYGYMPLPDDGFSPPQLLPEDEPDRLSIQLYHRVAGECVKGRDVLEVSCGHGGGASYMARYLQPRSLVGLDLNAAAIDFCREQYKDVPNLSYLVGDAERLPLGDSVVDAVVNVEAAHCYGSMEKFLREVRRVLRPGGYLLFADMHMANEKASLEALFKAAGFRTIDEVDLTPNMVAALREDNSRKVQLIEENPRWLQSSLAEFSCTEGTRGYQSFAGREELYLGYTLQLDAE